MRIWLRIFIALIIITGLICFIIGLQESIAIKKGFLEYSLSVGLDKKVKDNLSIEHIKKSMFYTGIKHSFYGILMVISGVGMLLRKSWSKLLFLAVWFIIFTSNIYYVIKGQSYFYILVLSLGIFLISLLIFHKPAFKKYFIT